MALEKAGHVPKTQAQIVNIGVEIIRNTQDFETGISERFERPLVEYTWQILNPTSQPLIMP